MGDFLPEHGSTEPISAVMRAKLRLAADDEALPIRSPILSMQLLGHQPQLHKHLAEELLLSCRQGLPRITELSVKKTSDELR
jgi:hypothetical protein